MKNNKAVWKKDWFLGVVVVLVFWGLWKLQTFELLELKAYDLGMKLTSREPSDKVAVVAIDDASLDNIGRWPWSRSIVAQMIDKLTNAQAKTVAVSLFLSEAQHDPGLQYVERIAEVVRRSSTASSEIQQVVHEAQIQLNPDLQLTKSLATSKRVVLPILLDTQQQGNPEGPLPPDIATSVIARQNVRSSEAQGGGAPYIANQIILRVLPDFARNVTVGHLNTMHSLDGVLRDDPIVLAYGDDLIPSFALATVASYLNTTPDRVVIELGSQVELGTLQIKVDANNLVRPFFYKQGFAVDSFYDVLNGKISLDKYKGKIVLIGATANGVQSFYSTPTSNNMPSVLVAANEISSLLKGDVVAQPFWTLLLAFLAIFLVAVYLIGLLPRLNARMAAIVTAVTLLALLITEFSAMISKLVWIPMISPAILLIVGHLLLTTKRLLTTEKGKIQSDAASAESNRMLGLAYQGQGQLDMAWDKFSAIPMHDGLLDNLYSLALDFERKRQFNKAEIVFRHMHAFNPKFKDVGARIERAQRISETVILGGAQGGGTLGATILSPGGEVEKPMLGRYVVEKELGKGAMGIVYLGRDPKINRVVAIKTMVLSQEFDPEELVEVKDRFFREAETAGRLNHPNIVTIYDAGEEQDLCYIAMEFLKGKDLAGNIKQGQLLPMKQVALIISQVADALAYAHLQGVVHRDIKPGNIMFQAEGGAVKVTDFGIARITDASRTKTGMVLGTPSYMSPEQLAGQKIDGRSDIFSLGVTLYQLLCAALPFQGESLTQLMYQITHADPEDIRNRNHEIPDSFMMVINRALQKEPDKRYATGSEMAEDLRKILADDKQFDVHTDISL